MRRYEIVICSCEEIIAEGVLPPDASPIDSEEVAAAFVSAAASVIERHPRYIDHLSWHDDSNYARWRGGTHYRVGETIDGQKYGYSAGLVVTHTTNPPKWLCDLCDAAHAAGFAAATAAAAAAKQEDLTQADVCEAAGDLETAEHIRDKWEGF